MKKTLFIILALCSMSYGLSGYSMYKTYVAKDTVTHINLDSNFYRGVNWSNKLADTIDRNFIRWYDFNSHDSTLRYFKVDTIRSNPNIDSIAGNTVITGAPIVTGALTVDSLKSTKGINATGGTFSGRVTGTDIDVSDSVKGVTGNYTSTVTAKDVNVTDLISGYIPYKSTNLENSNIFTNGTNTSIGKSSIESWGVSQRAVQVGGNTAIMGNALESGSNFTWLLNNAYYDGTWKPYSNGSTSSFRIGATGILFEHDTGLTADIGYSPTTRLSLTLAGGLNVTNKIVTSDSIIAVSGKFTGALSSTTLNTGYGNNELHPMDQGVRTTDDVTFDSTTQRIITVNNGDSAGILVGPNTSFGATLRIGGWNTNDARARITVSNGNIHIDSDTSQQGVYINNYYPEDVYIGNGGGIVDINKANADSLKLGTGSYLKTYVEGTLPCTLKTSDVTVQQVGTINYTIIGNVVHLTFPYIYGTSNSTTLRLYCGGLTGLLDPARIVCYDVPYVTDNATSHNGNVTYLYGSGNYFLFSMKDATGFTSSGYKGVGGFLLTNKTTITYTK